MRKLGQIVYSERRKNFTGEYSETIELNKQPQGIYFIEIAQGQSRKVEKIVIE